jgi:hypothetical protein
MNILAIISGDALVQTLIYLVCIAVVFWLLWWLISYVAPPEPFNKVLRVIVAVAAVIFLISILMSLAGHPIFK